MSKKCKEGSSLNVDTNRCRKDCNITQERNPKTKRCRKICKDTQFRNDDKGRCRNVAKEKAPVVAYVPEPLNEDDLAIYDNRPMYNNVSNISESMPFNSLREVVNDIAPPNVERMVFMISVALSPMSIPGNNSVGVSPMSVRNNSVGVSPMSVRNNSVGVSPMNIPGNSVGVSPMSVRNNSVGVSPMNIPGIDVGASPMSIGNNSIALSPIDIPELIQDIFRDFPVEVAIVRMEQPIQPLMENSPPIIQEAVFVVSVASSNSYDELEQFLLTQNPEAFEEQLRNYEDVGEVLPPTPRNRNRNQPTLEEVMRNDDRPVSNGRVFIDDVRRAERLLTPTPPPTRRRVQAPSRVAFGGSYVARQVDNVVVPVPPQTPNSNIRPMRRQSNAIRVASAMFTETPSFQLNQPVSEAVYERPAISSTMERIAPPQFDLLHSYERPPSREKVSSTMERIAPPDFNLLHSNDGGLSSARNIVQSALAGSIRTALANNFDEDGIEIIELPVSRRRIAVIPPVDNSFGVIVPRIRPISAPVIRTVPEDVLFGVSIPVPVVTGMRQPLRAVREDVNFGTVGAPVVQRLRQPLRAVREDDSFGIIPAPAPRIRPLSAPVGSRRSDINRARAFPAGTFGMTAIAEEIVNTTVAQGSGRRRADIERLRAFPENSFGVTSTQESIVSNVSQNLAFSRRFYR